MRSKWFIYNCTDAYIFYDLWHIYIYMNMLYILCIYLYIHKFVCIYIHRFVVYISAYFCCVYIYIFIYGGYICLIIFIYVCESNSHVYSVFFGQSCFPVFILFLVEETKQKQPTTSKARVQHYQFVREMAVSKERVLKQHLGKVWRRIPSLKLTTTGPWKYVCSQKKSGAMLQL